MLTEHLIYHLASLKERERLSRELHDHLAPGLGYIKIQTALINEALNRNELDQARQLLQELKELAKRVNEVMPKMMGVMGKLMKYASDPKFMEAQKKFAEAMSTMK